MANYSKGEFKFANPQKYIGTLPCIWRSSWEFSMMKCFDTHPNVLHWASESLTVPYLNPCTQRWSMYVPDFFVIYMDKDGKKHAEVIEIKPHKEAFGPKSRRDRLVQAINLAKWSAVMGYCKKRGFTFRVMTENDLFKFMRR